MHVPSQTPGTLDCRWSREWRSAGPWGASSLGPVGVAGAGTPADAVDTASLGGGDFGLLQQGGQGDMLESRRATPRRARLSRPSFEHLRAAPLLGTHRLSTSLGQVVQPSVVVAAPFPPAVFQRAHRNNHKPRARTAPPRLRRELLLGALSSDWRPPYGQQDLNLSSARLV